MSHAQHMQAWRENQFKKNQRKRPYSNQYGVLSERSLGENVTNRFISTQPMISRYDSLPRLPTSPSQYLHERSPTPSWS
jgi:hypothetical protein